MDNVDHQPVCSCTNASVVIVNLMLFYEKYIASTAAAHAAKLCGPDPLPHAAQHLGGEGGARGHNFPSAESLWECRITAGVQKSSNNVTSTPSIQ